MILIIIFWASTGMNSFIKIHQLIFFLFNSIWIHCTTLHVIECDRNQLVVHNIDALKIFLSITWKGSFQATSNNDQSWARMNPLFKYVQKLIRKSSRDTKLSLCFYEHSIELKLKDRYSTRQEIQLKSR